MTFVRTDASREITLVSPLAASGRHRSGEASDAGGKRRPWRRALSAVASGGARRPVRDRKSQVVPPPNSSGSISDSNIGRVCF